MTTETLRIWINCVYSYRLADCENRSRPSSKDTGFLFYNNMTQEEFNQQYMHYYLRSGVRTKCINKNSPIFGQLDWLTSTAYSIHNGKTGAVAMILKDLANMSEKDCLQLVDLSQSLTGQVDHIEIYKTHIECDCTDEDNILPFKFYVLFDELNPKQFDYLLKKGYNLFDPEWKYTIKAMQQLE